MENLVLVNEGMYYTGVEQSNAVEGGIEFVQSFPDMLLGCSCEKVLIRKEDIGKVIEYLQNIK